MSSRSSLKLFLPSLFAATAPGSDLSEVWIWAFNDRSRRLIYIVGETRAAAEQVASGVRIRREGIFLGNAT